MELIIIAYHVVYHTDTEGFIKSLREIMRVLKRSGELFVTLNSKNSLSYHNIDNTEVFSKHFKLIVSKK